MIVHAEQSPPRVTCPAAGSRRLLACLSAAMSKPHMPRYHSGLLTRVSSLFLLELSTSLEVLGTGNWNCFLFPRTVQLQDYCLCFIIDLLLFIICKIGQRGKE